MIKRTDFLEKVRPFIGLDIIKVITGLRRSGKSVLMKQIRDMILSEIDPLGKCIYVNLEDSENARFVSPGVLHSYVSEIAKENEPAKTYVFLDEISEVEEWEKTVNSLRAKENIDVYVTGSNSKLLSGELATHLTGRFVEIKVMPFSFREFMAVTEAKDKESAFDTYMKFGGMPFLSHLNYLESPSRDYLLDLYSSILLKDIVKRYKVRDVELLTRIIGYAMSESGHIISAASIQRYLKSERRSIAFDTVMNYLQFGEEAYLFNLVTREDLIGKRILAVDEKVYGVDHGMRNAIVGGNVARDIERTLETIVYWEFVRRGYDVRIGRLKDKEVDFVCKKNGEPIYVQVCYVMESELTREREFSALLGIPDQYPKMILSLDRIDFSSAGIQHKRIPDFLLEDR